MISVLIVEDEPLIAEAHRTYLGRLQGFSVAGVAHTARAAMRTASEAVGIASQAEVDRALTELRGNADKSAAPEIPSQELTTKSRVLFGIPPRTSPPSRGRPCTARPAAPRTATSGASASLRGCAAGPGQAVAGSSSRSAVTAIGSVAIRCEYRRGNVDASENAVTSPE